MTHSTTTRAFLRYDIDFHRATLNEYEKASYRKAVANGTKYEPSRENLTELDNCFDLARAYSAGFNLAVNRNRKTKLKVAHWINSTLPPTSHVSA